MKELVSSARASVGQANWYSALAIALTLPDICGRLEFPAKASGERYADWFTKYVAPRYFDRGRQFLTGGDCYALRCAFLHQGELDIAGQRARDALDAFIFAAPIKPGFVVHNNLCGKRLQLQVDVFVEDVCCGVDQWLGDTAMSPEVIQRIGLLGKITVWEGSIKLPRQ